MPDTTYPTTESAQDKGADKTQERIAEGGQINVVDGFHALSLLPGEPASAEVSSPKKAGKYPFQQ